MEYTSPLLVSIANRTLANLTRIELIDQDEAARGVAEADRTVYPVTQLLNSLLGLIVFPKEEYSAALPNRSLDDLHRDGWPKVEISYPHPQCTVAGEKCQKNHSTCTNLHQLIRVLRNGLAHFNLEFANETSTEEEGGRITGVSLSNRCPCCKNFTTTIRLTIEQVRALAIRYSALITESGE